MTYAYFTHSFNKEKYSFILSFYTLLTRDAYIKLRLKKIHRKFLWEGGIIEHKAYLVRCVAICLDKRKGGLRGVFLLSTRLFFCK